MMAEAQEQPQAAAAAEAEAGGLLDGILSNTPQTTTDRAKDMVEELVGRALAGEVVWDKTLTRTVNKAIDAIDAKLSKQLAAVMQHDAFQKLEGSWRGLKYLINNSETGASLKIKVFNSSKKDLMKDLDSAGDFDQSQLFKKIYEEEFGSPGGKPYGALIGDYEFSTHPDDIDALRSISGVAAASFCPFISAASSKMFGLESYQDLAKPTDLKKVFEAKEYTAWRSLRETPDAAFVNLVAPRVLARLPYGNQTKPIDEFAYEEALIGSDGKPAPMDHENFTWMNAAYALGARLTSAYAEHGWCTAIRGVEGGGKVEALPTYVFKSDDGDTDLKCPTEIGITDRREKELSDLGFLPLCHFKDTDYSVFFGGQSIQKPTVYSDPDATANAAISARLPYVMAVSRITHFLKVMGRDKVGAFMERQDVEDFMKRWISDYICADSNPTQDMKSKFPLAEAQIKVEEVPGAPGSYNAVAHLRPWLQMEELTTSMRLVARIPKQG